MTTTREASYQEYINEKTPNGNSRLDNIILALCADAKRERHVATQIDMAFQAGWSAALSTPATDPQGYVVKPLVWDGNETDCYVSCDMGSVSYELIVSYTLERSCDYVWAATYHDGKAPAIPLGHGTFLEAQTAAQAHHENRIGGFLAARPAPQPAAEHEYHDPLIAEDRYEDDQPASDTRMVTVAQLEKWLNAMPYTYKSHAEIRAIIGNATPAPSNKIAGAARDCRPENYASGVQCRTCGQSWGEDGPEQCPNAALAGKGE